MRKFTMVVITGDQTLHSKDVRKILDAFKFDKWFDNFSLENTTIEQGALYTVKELGGASKVPENVPVITLHHALLTSEFDMVNSLDRMMTSHEKSFGYSLQRIDLNSIELRRLEVQLSPMLTVKDESSSQFPEGILAIYKSVHIGYEPGIR